MGDYEKKIAVLFRGACSFETKIHNAFVANASAVVVINNNPDGVVTINFGDNGSNSLLVFSELIF